MNDDPGGGWRVEGGAESPPATGHPPPGCNPLVFGVVMATIQMGALLWLLFGR